jgi:flavin reductase (DIM6/NTAB) family NADH-FMN oxidoreductase RutF
MSEKIQVHYDSLLKETLEPMTNFGLLLVAQGRQGKPNAMAIGWGVIGSIWSQPIFTVLVRPSRYTYELLEEDADFTVNVMPPKMKSAVDLCGSASGRTHDKFAEAKLTAMPALHVKAPIIAESIIAYECRTMMTTDVPPDRLDRKIRDTAYSNGDFHRLFFGKILCVRAEHKAGHSH